MATRWEAGRLSLRKLPMATAGGGAAGGGEGWGGVCERGGPVIARFVWWARLPFDPWSRTGLPEDRYGRAFMGLHVTHQFFSAHLGLWAFWSQHGRSCEACCDCIRIAS